MNRIPARILLAVLLLLAPCGCGSKSGSSLPVVQMQIGNQSFNLEVATTPAEQSNGLMHRDSLDPDHGMIFVFNQPQGKEMQFWNHDVHFPLDLIFLDSGGTVISIKHMDAWKETGVGSDYPYYYAVELNSGTAQKVGLKFGDHLSIPKDAQSAAAQAP